jgi:hypothetical protein
VGALVVVLLGAVGWAVQDREPPTDVVDAPAPVLSRTPGATDGLDALLGLPTPPAIDDAVVQVRWDPRTAADLPAVDLGLPESLDPPADAPELTSMPPAVAMVEGERGLSLVDTDGIWRRLSLPEQPLAVPSYSRTSRLSTDGTRVVFLGRTSLWSRDVRSTRWRRIDHPDGFLAPGVPTGARKIPVVLPLVAEHLVLQRDRTWFVDLDTETFEVVDASLLGTTWGGGTYVTTGPEPKYGFDVLQWGSLDGPTRAFRIDGLATLSSIVNDAGTAAAVRGACVGADAPGGPSRRALVALALDDLSARAYLPVRDPLGDYTCGSGLQTLAWLDPDTVLVSVRTSPGSEAAGRTLVTWDVETGGLRRVATLPTGASYDIASMALAVPPAPG